MVRIFAAPFITGGTSSLGGSARLVVLEVLRVLAMKPIGPRTATLHKYAGRSHIVTVALTEGESNG